MKPRTSMPGAGVCGASSILSGTESTKRYSSDSHLWREAETLVHSLPGALTVICTPFSTPRVMCMCDMHVLWCPCGCLSIVGLVFLPSWGRGSSFCLSVLRLAACELLGDCLASFPSYRIHANIPGAPITPGRCEFRGLDLRLSGLHSGCF